ncbi:hypothetical protein H0H93_013269 [Arthromyces matolae]|nr:hypothetical protein H0H93_013269 [Arthromyces matolae]
MSQADSSVDIPAHPEPHLLQCSVDAAMTPYIGTMEGRPLLGEDATAGIFDAILEELVENKILNKDGWKAIRTSKQGQIEDAVYDLLALIDSDLKPTTTLRSTGTVISAPETDPFNLEPAKPYTQFFGHNPLTVRSLPFATKNQTDVESREHQLLWQWNTNADRISSRAEGTIHLTRPWRPSEKSFPLTTDWTIIMITRPDSIITTTWSQYFGSICGIWFTEFRKVLR